MKPLFALAGIAVLGTTAVAGALVLASSDSEDQAVSQAETATPVPSGAKDPKTAPTVGTCEPGATPPPACNSGAGWT